MLTKPTLILDEKKCKKNIHDMFLKAQESNIDFRPHFKTHQSLEIGGWFKELGVNKITVSSLDMATYFSKEWDDITVAFPTNILEIDTINELASRINLNLLIESQESIQFLHECLTSKVNFFIKIDVGYHRTGINPLNSDLIGGILQISNNCDKIDFKGFLGHAGHTYQCRNKNDIITIHEESVQIMTQLKSKYIAKHPDFIISLGDTPSCSVAKSFEDIDEIRPGNFVFYDLTQNLIGSNTIEQIAVAMACPIVAIHEGREEIVIYGGGVHFSKDRLDDPKYGTIYGKIVKQNEDTTWGDLIPDMYVKSLSQEHGIISVPKQLIKNYKVGDLLFILPVHSCMTADLIKQYLTTEGNKI